MRVIVNISLFLYTFLEHTIDLNFTQGLRIVEERTKNGGKA